jgi:hypothetical protein
MHADRTDRIVDLENRVDEIDADDHQHAGHRPDR